MEKANKAKGEKERTAGHSMTKQVIRSIRKGSVQWNEEDRLQIATLLLKCGYTAKITHREASDKSGKKTAQKEYVIEFWEEE